MTDILTQPRRAALLVFLTLALPEGRRSRESVAEMFWPERTSLRSRTALRGALHYLRNGMGGCCFRNGDLPYLGVERGSVWCDAQAFESAFGEGRHRDALDLYRGDFLEGFGISDAPEFERWQESERGRLRRCATEAALELSRQCETACDLHQAARWTRRALDLSPYDETCLRRLMRLLAAQGHRPEAVLLYRAFQHRLSQELGLTPAPKTRTLFQTICQDPTPRHTQPQS